ncbi:unnamed protein product [Rhizoctonia solani]|uniref:SH3 domain-containing protein n=1 Tax=Rhizoctonia solani TaxID=456999 RepID=A0A8H3H1F1_9AGAM|nr:unnamed protein product [Rhizoctonia solani]
MATSYSVGITLRNFKSSHGSGGGEFTIKKGQRLLLMESSHAEWWKFALKTNREKNNGSSGFVPKKYIQEVKSISAATSRKDFVAQAGGDLTITEHEGLSVYCVEGDWALVKSARAAGYVPTECIELNDEPDQVIALFDFNVTDPGKLSFQKGETLTVLDRKYEHWCLCKNGSDMLGVVPRNRVEVHNRLGSGSSIEEITKPTISQQYTPISKKKAAREVVSELARRDWGRRSAADPAYERSRVQKPTRELSALDAWNSYELRWSALSVASPYQPIGFRDIPWPLLCVPSDPESITPQAVGALILSLLHSQERWMTRIDEDERPKVKEALDAIHYSLNELMTNPHLYTF